jgi:hypothetical protein
VDLPAFEAHVAAAPLSFYGATRHLFLHTRTAHALAARGRRADFAAFAPAAAAEVTRALVDGCWSTFYASGDPAALARVLDVGVLYLPHADEYGDSALAAPGAGAPADEARWDDDFDGDAVARMRFDAGRHALWSLLANAQAHVQVGGWLLRQAGDALDGAALLDPVSRLATVSRDDERRLQLQRLLAPALRAAHAHALDSGIGCGRWPPSYDDGGGGGGAAPQLEDGAAAASPLHGAAADSSAAVHLGADVAAVLGSGDAAGDAAGAGRDARDGARRLLARARGR